MKIPIPIQWLLVILILMSTYTYAEKNSSDRIVVISSSQNDIQALSKQEVRQIFMGGVLSRKYVPVMQTIGNEDRASFNTSIIGLTENRIQAYWSQLVFTGRSTAPLEIQNQEELILYLRTNTKAVSYVSSSVDLPDDILVVYGN